MCICSRRRGKAEDSGYKPHVVLDFTVRSSPPSASPLDLAVSWYLPGVRIQLRNRRTMLLFRPPGINLSEVVNKWTVVALKDALSEGAPATNGVSRIVAVVERAITWDSSFGTGRRCRIPLEAQFALHHVLWRYVRWIRCRTSPSTAVDLVNKDPEIVRLSGNLGKEVPSAIELGTIRMTYSTVG